MVTAYLAPDMPDSARRLLDSCQECQPDRGARQRGRQDPAMLDRPDSQGSSTSMYFTSSHTLRTVDVFDCTFICLYSMYSAEGECTLMYLGVLDCAAGVHTYSTRTPSVLLYSSGTLSL
jgi:hypothetical protein